MRAAGHAGDAGHSRSLSGRRSVGIASLDAPTCMLLQARSRRTPSEGLTASTTRPTCSGSCMRSGADATPCASVSPSPAARRRAARRSGGCSTHSTSSATARKWRGRVAAAPLGLRGQPGPFRGGRARLTPRSLSVARARPKDSGARFRGKQKDLETPCVPPIGIKQPNNADLHPPGEFQPRRCGAHCRLLYPDVHP